MKKTIKKIKEYKYTVTIKISGTVRALDKEEARDIVREQWDESISPPDDCEIKVELDK